MGNWAATTVLPPIDFDGDSISLTVTRVLTEDMGVLSKYHNADKKAVVFADHIELCKMAASWVKKYVREVKGMTKSTGEPMTVNELGDAAGEFYFVAFNIAFFTALSKVSTLSQVEAKNSVPPLPA